MPKIGVPGISGWLMGFTWGLKRVCALLDRFTSCFRSHALLDTRAITAALAYEDLNRIRAGIAETLRAIVQFWCLSSNQHCLIDSRVVFAAKRCSIRVPSRQPWLMRTSIGFAPVSLKHYEQLSNFGVCPVTSNVYELYNDSVAEPDGKRRTKDGDANLHRFAKPSQGKTHWNGFTGKTGRGEPTRASDV
jgi:hypothetical protein